jgi:apolipoprotein N-acyltransferase
MRALETGRWIVRAASTGISGIIAPNGRYVRASGLNVEATIDGAIGKASPAFFPEIGSLPFVVLFVLAYVAIVALGRHALRAR